MSPDVLVNGIRSRRAGDACLSDLLLDRLLAGELGGGEEATAHTHLSSCADCAARRDALEAEITALPRTTWIAGDVARIARAASNADHDARTRGHAGLRPIAPRLGSMIAAASAIAACLVLGLRLPGADGVRTKGSGIGLDLFVRHDGRVRAALPGDAVAAGDALRFQIATPRGGFAAIVGLDSTPRATVYVPTTGAMPRVAPGRSLLDGSIVLDDTPGVEREVGLVCASPLDAAALSRAGATALARAGGNPAAVTGLGIPGCRESSVLVRKAAPAP